MCRHADPQQRSCAMCLVTQRAWAAVNQTSSGKSGCATASSMQMTARRRSASARSSFNRHRQHLAAPREGGIRDLLLFMQLQAAGSICLSRAAGLLCSKAPALHCTEQAAWQCHSAAQTGQAAHRAAASVRPCRTFFCNADLRSDAPPCQEPSAPGALLAAAAAVGRQTGHLRTCWNKGKAC
jgi:hypothetical protein